VTRALAFSLLLIASACSGLPGWMQREPDRTTGVESLYWRALAALDTSSKSRSLETAIALLDGYLASAQRTEHRAEALVLRQLTRDAQELAKVQVALDQTKTAPASAAAPQRAESDEKGRDEALREIQRLKDELAKANAELERIRKRLANPKEPL
jgi:hypothetical protein